MAFSDLSESSGQEVQATAEMAGPGGRTAREQFDALPQDLRDKIIERNYEVNTDGIDWWDSVYDMFREDMKSKGIDVGRMYFSGFWSQGDGACFEGIVDCWTDFLKSMGYEDAALIDHAEEHFQGSWSHSGHYYHEHCVRFNLEMPLPEHDEDDYFIEYHSTHERGSLHEAVWMANINKYRFEDLERSIVEALKDHMRDLYRDLEQEYDYLTSEEAILEHLDTNDLLQEEIDYVTEIEHA